MFEASSIGAELFEQAIVQEAITGHDAAIVRETRRAVVDLFAVRVGDATARRRDERVRGAHVPALACIVRRDVRIDPAAGDLDALEPGAADANDLAHTERLERSVEPRAAMRARGDETCAVDF